ncbi:hypothetical protein GQ457_04G008490 [Hibiscus cannabinus]
MTIENNISSIWLASPPPSPWQQVPRHIPQCLTRTLPCIRGFCSQHNSLLPICASGCKAEIYSNQYGLSFSKLRMPCLVW